MEFTKEPTASSWESFLDFDFPFALPSTSDGSSDDNTTLLLPEAVASPQAKDNCDIRSDSSEAGLSLLDFKGENSILNVEGCTRDDLELNEDACSSSQSAVGLGCTEAAAPPTAALLTVGESSQNESGANERIIQTSCAPKPPAVKRQRVAKPRKPKKPRTGYNYFHLMSRSIFMDDLKGQGIMKGDKERLNAEVNRRIAQQWRTLTPSDKTMYTEKAEADKVRYEEEMRAYRNATGPPSHEHAPGNQNHSQSRCLPGTLDELRALATKLGIKKQGKGWQLCCPPNGVKSDICRAIVSHLNLPQDGSLATARALDHLLRKNSSTATAATTDRIVASETTSSAEGVGGMDIDFAVPPAAVSISSSSSPPPLPPPSLSQGKVSSSTPPATTTTTANNIKNNAVADIPGTFTAFATMQRPISGNNNEHKKRPSHKSQQCAAGTTGPRLPLPTPPKRGGKQQPMPLMSMRSNNLATPSRSWLLELAQKHNLLSDDTKPFLKDAMAAIEKEVSLTMTRMSRQVLKLVSRQQHPAAGNDNHLSFNNKKRKNQATDGASASGSSSGTAAAAAFHTFNLVDCEPNEQKFIANPELVRMINTVSRSNISRPQSLVKLSSGEVKGFFLLNKPLCDLLIREAKRCAKACRLKLGQISLKRLGLHGAVSRLASECIIPTVGLSAEERYDIEGSVIYDGDRPLFDDYRYSCDPADGWSFSGSERSLPTHKDDSMITINMCLGERFTGGSVLFEDIVEIEHQVCRGIVHPGNMRHKITPCRGQRFNLILFLNKKSSC